MRWWLGIALGAAATQAIAAFAPTHKKKLLSSLPRSPSRSPSRSRSTHHDNVIEIILPRNVLNTTTAAQLDDWVAQRAAARWQGDYATADAWRQRIEESSSTALLSHDDHHQLAVRLEDIPRKQGGGSRWSLVWIVDNQSNQSRAPTVLQLAHAALGLAVSASQTRLDYSAERTALVQQALSRLQAWAFVQEQFEQGNVTWWWWCDPKDDASPSKANPVQQQEWVAVEQELRGRKAADAAFWFAMAGVTTNTTSSNDDELYDLLLRVGLKELQRFGQRPSCRAKDVWAMVDRFAAAGIRPNGKALRLLSFILNSKAEEGHEVSVDEILSRWDLHSDACALLVWKFSTRQRKQRDFLTTAARHWETQQQNFSDSVQRGLLAQPSYDWTNMYTDPTRPLVVDIGCGMGLSLLGIASTAANEAETWHAWENCNFFGVDLNSLAVGYAQGLSKRWDLEESLQFVVDTAEHALEAILSTYPGPVAQILIQFPTPFRLLPKESTNVEYQGNTQLPKDSEDGFMVSRTLLRLVGQVLEKSSGTLLLQSNCEDVALHMYETAIQKSGIVGILSKDPRWEMPQQTTQRTETWLAGQTGPEIQRAKGSTWWNSPVLSTTCQTETEIACSLNGTPVHRCLLKAARAVTNPTQEEIRQRKF